MRVRVSKNDVGCDGEACGLQGGLKERGSAFKDGVERKRRALFNEGRKSGVLGERFGEKAIFDKKNRQLLYLIYKKSDLSA